MSVRLEKYNTIKHFNNVYEERIKELLNVDEQESNIVEVTKDVLEGKYFGIRKPNKPLYPLNHVFDENKSVKWNRDKVEKENTEIQRFNEEQKYVVANKHNEFKKALADVLKENYGLEISLAMTVIENADSEKMRLGDRTQVGVILRTLDYMNLIFAYAEAQELLDDSLSDDEEIDMEETDYTEED